MWVINNEKHFFLHEQNCLRMVAFYSEKDVHNFIEKSAKYTISEIQRSSSFFKKTLFTESSETNLKTSYICRTRLIWSCNGDFLYFQVKVFSQCDFPPNLSKTWHLKWVYNFLGCEHKSKVLNLFKAKNKYTRIHQRCI